MKYSEIYIYTGHFYVTGVHERGNKRARGTPHSLLSSTLYKHIRLWISNIKNRYLFKMESSASHTTPEVPRYIQLPAIEPGTLRDDGSLVLNRWSSTLTKDHDFPGAQVWLMRLLFSSILISHQAMLYAAGVPNRNMMKMAPQVGISTVWWEGNPCKWVPFPFKNFLILTFLNSMHRKFPC